jgi:hypothetical protein
MTNVYVGKKCTQVIFDRKIGILRKIALVVDGA